jgi:hypothetical protein
MFQKTFHLRAICGWTISRGAGSGMEEKRHVKLYTPLSFLPLRLRKFGLLRAGNSNRLQLMGMTGNFRILVAILTLIKISTCGTMKAVARQDFARTCRALLHELGSISIVQMPQNHHGGMLGSTYDVKLIVVPLTKV